MSTCTWNGVFAGPAVHILQYTGVLLQAQQQHNVPKACCNSLLGWNMVDLNLTTGALFG
jgi:hypothetical protein